MHLLRSRDCDAESFDALHWILLQDVLPDPDHHPSLAPKFPRIVLIAPPVPFNFREPIIRIRLWDQPAFRTTMPITSIDKDSDVEFRKDEVRMSAEGAVPSPTRNARTSHGRNQG